MYMKEAWDLEQVAEEEFVHVRTFVAVATAAGSIFNTGLVAGLLQELSVTQCRWTRRADVEPVES
jgi:hypothetical protein